jgi:hypothetical protein
LYIYAGLKSVYSELKPRLVKSVSSCDLILWNPLENDGPENLTREQKSTAKMISKPYEKVFGAKKYQIKYLLI